MGRFVPYRSPATPGRPLWTHSPIPRVIDTHTQTHTDIHKLARPRGLSGPRAAGLRSLSRHASSSPRHARSRESGDYKGILHLPRFIFSAPPRPTPPHASKSLGSPSLYRWSARAASGAGSRPGQGAVLARLFLSYSWKLTYPFSHCTVSLI